MSGSSLENARQHDAYVDRLSRIANVEMWTLDDAGVPVVEFLLSGDIVRRLLIDDANLRGDIDVVAGEIMYWGRVVARQRRCHQVSDRIYRQWRASKEIAFRKAVESGLEKGWGQGGRASTEQVEAAYRTDPDYETVNGRVEATEESYNVADAIYRAFKQKADLLAQDVRRAPDGALQRLSP